MTSLSNIAKLSIAYISALLLCAGAASAVEVNVELVKNGFDDPVFLTHAPNDSARLFILEQPGVIRIIKNGTTLATPFLDITAQTISGGERGLLGLAFHPQYPANPYFYLNYTATGGGSGGQTIIARFEVSANPDIANPASEILILAQSQPEANHNGGMIAFGPMDGYLYVGFGDGGGFGDNHGSIGNGQDPQTLLGKMIRIDVDGGSPYDIPLTNPFLSDGSTLDEIWATGLRNPWRWSFDRETGDMYIGDVGQGSWEEIDFESGASAGGINWGWRLTEGSHCYNPSSNCDPAEITTEPIFEYGHTLSRCSVTGGYVYRGCAIPELRGTYFYGDYCTGEVWSLEFDGAVQNQRDRFNLSLVSSFGEDAAGELYICQLSGEIFKIVPQSTPASCGSCCDTAGDANNDGKITIGDVTFLISRIFTGGTAPVCFDEGDANGSNTISIGDVTYLISHIFSAGPAPICGTTGS